MNKQHLKYPGIYLASKGEVEVIINVGAVAPFLTIKSLFDLTEFKNSGVVKMNESLKQNIITSPNEWLYKPLDNHTAVTLETIDYLPACSIEITEEEYLHYSKLLDTCGQWHMLTRICRDKKVTLTEARWVEGKIREKLKNQ